MTETEFAVAIVALAALGAAHAAFYALWLAKIIVWSVCRALGAMIYEGGYQARKWRRMREAGDM